MRKKTEKQASGTHRRMPKGAGAASSMKLQRRRASSQHRKLPRRSHCAEQQQHQHHQQQQRQRCICLPSNYAPAQFPTAWSELRSSQQLFDGAIECTDGRVFPVHRVILSAASPYFRALFTSSLRPAEGGCELARVEASANVLSLVLDYAYTGTCKVGRDNVESLLTLADRLEVLGVVQLCCHFLLGELGPDNCLGIYKFAQHYFCCDLEKRVCKYVRRNFKEIVQESSEFKELSSDDLEPILRDDELNARNEELVFEAIKTWVEFRPSERSSELPRLLSCVRYGLMWPQYFNDEILPWSVAQNQECKNVLKSAALYFEDRRKKRQSSLQSGFDDELSRPRISYEILFAVGGWSCGAPTNFIETYDVRSDRWLPSAYTDVSPRAYHGICTLNNLIYVIGGYNGKKHVNTMRCFNPLSKEWSEKACMHHVRCYVSVCVLDGKIYALGGNNRMVRLSSCERYDPDTNQWELIAPMNWYRSDASAAALHGRIYVIGGFDGYEILDSAEVYDVAADQWSYIARMRVPRTGVSLVAFRNCLYAIGGFDGYDRLSSGEKYDPFSELDEWKEIAEMYNPRSNFATAILDNMIFAIGGYNGSLPVSWVECYDAHRNKWYGVSPMSVGRSALSVCVIAGLMNAREYSRHLANLGPWPRRRRADKSSTSTSAMVV